MKQNISLSFFLGLLGFLLTVLAWRLIPSMTITSEGFTWFDPGQYESLTKNLPNQLFSNQLLAVLLGTILPSIFGLKISLYYFFELAILLVINALLFVTVLKLTGKRVTALAAALFFSVNYVGNFSLIVGAYAYFLERVVQLPLLILSFLLLHLFLTKQKIKYYLLAVLLYFLATFLSHWSIFFTTAWVIYPLTFSLFSYKTLKIPLRDKFLG